MSKILKGLMISCLFIFLTGCPKNNRGGNNLNNNEGGNRPDTEQIDEEEVKTQVQQNQALAFVMPLRRQVELVLSYMDKPYGSALDYSIPSDEADRCVVFDSSFISNPDFVLTSVVLKKSEEEITLFCDNDRTTMMINDCPSAGIYFLRCTNKNV